MNKETPEFQGQWNHFRNNYDYEYGPWADVEKAAQWPEGQDVKDFLDSIKNRIRRNGTLKQAGWHKDKLNAKMRKIMPEHGKNNPNARARSAQKIQQQGTGAWTPNFTGAVPQNMMANTVSPPPSQTTEMPGTPTEMMNRLAALEQRVKDLEARLQAVPNHN